MPTLPKTSQSAPAPAARAVRPRRRPGRSGPALAAGLLAALALGPAGPALAGAAAAGAPRQAPVWLPGDYVDLAPAGMPDFSQCRPEWSQPGSPGQWTYAGPVALADALWYLDSAAEPGGRPPPAVSDGFALVTGYPVIGPAVDDHDPANLFPLVEDLAVRAGTDGRGQQAAGRGTEWEALVAAAGGYLRARRLDRVLALETRAPPDIAWLTERLDRRAAVVLALGVWEAQAAGWRRVGGHYAAVAGFEAGAGALALADPLADAAALGGAGRALPPGAAGHSCREAPRAHDDPSVLAHDLYPLAAEPALPEGRAVLAGYFGPASQHEAAAFAGQNPSAALKPYRADWQRGTVVMAVDAALALAHPPPPASPTPPPSPTPPASATAPPSPTASATATRGLVVEATGTPVRVLARRLWLPFAGRGPRTPGR